MTVPDYLLTRLVELVVHGVDLADSLGVDPPAVGDDTWELAGRVVGDVARRRHGAAAHAMALSRPDSFSRVSAF